MNSLHARNVILGAGAMGSAAAYHLAKRGEPVLLVEQFRVGHDRGSSHGAARITRHSYADSHYARLMPEAFRVWRELEADAGLALYIRTGGVSLSPPGVDYVARVAANLKELGIPHRRMAGAELRRVNAQFGTPDHTDVVFEPDAGLLSAAKALRVQVALARQYGEPKFSLLEDVRIQRIDLEAQRPTLISEQHTITAERLIVTAGAWVGKLIPALAERLKATRQCVCYFRPGDPVSFSIGRFPIFIWKGAAELDAFYGMPDYLGGGVKTARHGGPPCDPDQVERSLHEADVAVVRKFLKEHIPALAEAPLASTETCLYTVAPGEDFVVGRWPGRADVIVASPCSGHGFKFSCLVGKVLADLAQQGKTAVEIGVPPAS
jgi:sarcosine oxidase